MHHCFIGHFQFNPNTKYITDNDEFDCKSGGLLSLLYPPARLCTNLDLKRLILMTDSLILVLLQYNLLWNTFILLEFMTAFVYKASRSSENALL